MSGSTHSCAPDRFAPWLRRRVATPSRLLIAFLALTALPAIALDAPALPPLVIDLAPNLKVQGGGELTFFGISVYDGYYWSPTRGWAQDGTFVLDLHYHRALDGAKIAERSVSEISKLGYGSAEQHVRWGNEMRRVFPNVKRGDRITGVNLPGGVVRYFHNGKPVGEIADPGFSQAFFGIWLDPKSSQQDFRQRLLGDKP